jgi:hypothetical protein
MGDISPRVLDAVLSDLSVSFDLFFPFLPPPNRPPNIPFFFFLPSPLSAVGVDGAIAECLDLIDPGDLIEPGVAVGGRPSNTWLLIPAVSTFIVRAGTATGLGAVSCACREVNVTKRLDCTSDTRGVRVKMDSRQKLGEKKVMESRRLKT